LIALSFDHQNHSKWHKWCYVRYNVVIGPNLHCSIQSHEAVVTLGRHHPRQSPYNEQWIMAVQSFFGPCSALQNIVSCPSERDCTVLLLLGSYHISFLKWEVLICFSKLYIFFSIVMWQNLFGMWCSFLLEFNHLALFLTCWVHGRGVFLLSLENNF